jgi:hypothetical protein
MELGKDGTRERWNLGKMELRKDGTRERWNSGKMDLGKDGTKKRWNSGKMELGKDGTRERWNSGKMELGKDGTKKRWNSGKMELGKDKAQKRWNSYRHVIFTTCSKLHIHILKSLRILRSKQKSLDPKKLQKGIFRQRLMSESSSFSKERNKNNFWTKMAGKRVSPSINFFLILFILSCVSMFSFPTNFLRD